MSFSVNRVKRFLSTTLNLIRTELFFGACFAQFYAVLFDALSDIEFSWTIVHIYSLVFLLILLFTFVKPQYKKEYRILSSAMYLLASIFILYIAYTNDYSNAAYFLVIFNYALVAFAMPNLTILGIVSAFFYWTFVMSYVFLNFNTETPFGVAIGSLLFISFAAFFIVFTRDVYKKRIKERELLLNHVFNNSNDGLILVNKKDYTIKDCNIIAERLFNATKRSILGKNIMKLQIKDKTIFDHLDAFQNETIELGNKEIIHYQKKVLKYLNHEYLLVQLKCFRSRAEMQSLFQMSRSRYK